MEVWGNAVGPAGKPMPNNFTYVFVLEGGTRKDPMIPPEWDRNLEPHTGNCDVKSIITLQHVRTRSWKVSVYDWIRLI